MHEVDTMINMVRRLIKQGMKAEKAVYLVYSVYGTNIKELYGLRQLFLESSK